MKTDLNLNRRDFLKTASAATLSALAAGYPRAHAFDDIAELSRDIGGILARPGPVFVWLKVYPEVQNQPIGRRRRWQTRSREQVLADLRGALAVAQ